MHATVALALKDLRLLVRQRMALFFTVVWPLVVAVLFGTMFSGSGNAPSRLKVAFADEDQTAGSRAFASQLEKSKDLDVLRADREQALSLVRHGTRVAAIVLPRGFGEAATRLFYGTSPKVELWIDPSRSAESSMLQGLLFKQGAERVQAVLGDAAASRDMVRRARESLREAPEGDARRAPVGRFLAELDQFLQTNPGGGAGGTASAWQPIDVEEKAVVRRASGPHPTTAFDVTFPQGILWGLISCVMTFGLGIVTERTHGTLLRLQMSPIPRAEVLAGKALACFAAIACVEAALFAIGRLFFGVRPSSWPLLALAGVSAGVGFVGIMMLVSVLGKTEESAAGAGWAAMMPLALLGGGMVPLFVMPAWMVAAGNVSPAKWAVVAFEGAIWRGFSTAEMLLPCAMLVALGAVCFAVGARALRPAA
jgi:ABC-2 type transport system permease protein